MAAGEDRAATVLSDRPACSLAVQAENTNGMYFAFFYPPESFSARAFQPKGGGAGRMRGQDGERLRVCLPEIIVGLPGGSQASVAGTQGTGRAGTVHLLTEE